MSIMSLFSSGRSDRSKFADFKPIDIGSALIPPAPPKELSETQWSPMTAPKAKTPGSSATWPVEYQRAMRRNVVDTPSGADAGRISQDNGRLAVFGRLQPGDTSDTYRFSVGSNGKFQLFAPNPAYNAKDENSRTSLGDVRLQVLDRNGTVIADSEPVAGLAFSAWVNMSTEGLKGHDLEAGQYTVKLTRKDGVDAKKGLDYTLFMVQGDPGRTTFYTVERQPQRQGPRQVQATPSPIVNLFS
ncbi:MAG: hypothetical protein EAZ99_02675 [Alphaproteobacteria bacterium]|nr:hypothetical protein [Alphaproteobacteria bacterium]TAD91569.1 MAG: hypothetical protein EAZ99_02675 [Alphaproteobacteria bacterium]